MCGYIQKLSGLVIRCMLFGFVGGLIFQLLSGTDFHLLPCILAMGLGAGWQITRPMSMVAIGADGIIFTAFFFAVRVALALLIGWIVLIPYTVYLAVQTIRN